MLQQINTENFQQMLSQFSTTELEGMVEKFPYFEQAHLLLAKKYQQENSPKFDRQLQLAALYVQDRELLYNLFKEKNSPLNNVAPVTISEPREKQPETVVQLQIAESVLVVESREEEKENIIIQQPVEVVAPPVFTDAESMARALEEIKQTIDAIQQISEETKTEEPVQTVQLIEAEEETEVAEVPQVTEIRIEENPPVTLEIPVPETADEEQTTASTIAEETIVVTGEETTEAYEPVREVFSRIQPHTFDEWLQAFNNKSAQKIPEKQEVTDNRDPDEELTQLFAANITVDYLHGLVKEETNYAKGLERFIEEQIQKHKHPESRKKQPEDELDPELVTETMAKVYEMQKKYSKAIKAYEALALKFPEKSSLFAARINFLKNIL